MRNENEVSSDQHVSGSSTPRRLGWKSLSKLRFVMKWIHATRRMTRRKINNKLRCHTRWRFVGPTGAQKKKKLRGKKPQHDRPPLRTEKLSTADTRSQHERVFLIYIWSEQIAYVYRSTSTRLHAIVYLVIYSLILSLSLRFISFRFRRAWNMWSETAAQ